MRHGRPTRIAIGARRQDDGAIVVDVCDDGGGLSDPGYTHGLGLVGMQERAGSLGGTLTVDNRGDGVTVSARFPPDFPVEPERQMQPEAMVA
jgi:signal transduction histidine kinase